MFPSLVGDIPDAKDRIARRPFFTVPRLGKDPVGVLRAQLKERERVRQRGASQTIQPQYGVAIGGLERGAGCYQGLLLSGHKTPTGRHQPEHLFWIALEEFHPDRMAGRILQMGDVLTLVEKAQSAFDSAESKKLEKKVRKEGMDLEDFLGAMRQMQKLGPMENLLKMLPGVNGKMLKQAKIDPNRMKHIEAIVLSMTAQERKKPDVMNGSRRLRVAKGAGRPISEVNKLLEQFREMQKMMKKQAAGVRR